MTTVLPFHVTSPCFHSHYMSTTPGFTCKTHIFRWAGRLGGLVSAPKSDGRSKETICGAFKVDQTALEWKRPLGPRVNCKFKSFWGEIWGKLGLQWAMCCSLTTLDLLLATVLRTWLFWFTINHSPHQKMRKLVVLDKKDKRRQASLKFNRIKCWGGGCYLSFLSIQWNCSELQHTNTLIWRSSPAWIFLSGGVRVPMATV